MGPDHRISVASALAFAICVAVVPSGCRKKARSEAPVASATAKPPLDRLAPGELAPGTEVLYGLVLPRGMRVTAQFPNVGHATGPLHAEDVANYVRDRVDARRVELGVVGTVFAAVHVTGGDPAKVYRVEVNSAGNMTEIVMRDVTPVPQRAADPTVPDVEKWRRAGYKPNGMPLDPLKLR